MNNQQIQMKVPLKNFKRMPLKLHIILTTSEEENSSTVIKLGEIINYGCFSTLTSLLRVTAYVLQ